MQSTRSRLNPRHPNSLVGVAVCLLIGAAASHAHTYCVGNATALQSALTDASDGGAYDDQDNRILSLAN
jgi:hypothetical protein